MKFVALISGGKDSIYSACKMIDEGHDLVGLVYMKSIYDYSDSYMFQTVGSEFVSLIAECFDRPLYIFNTNCLAQHKDLKYVPTEGDEVEELYVALKSVKKLINFEAVSSGAILSSYQKNRVQNISERLKIKSFTPLWGKDQKELLKEIINYGIDARIIKIACSSFSKNCINMSLNEILKYMDEKNTNMEFNYCGEGGEYESCVIDCPHFKKKMVLGNSEILPHPDEKDKNGCVFYCKFSNIEIINK